MRMSDERSTILKKIRGSQSSLRFWTPCCEFQIPGTEFQIVYQGTWIQERKTLVCGGFPDYLSCIQDFKAQNPDSTSKKFLDSGFYK